MKMAATQYPALGSKVLGPTPQNLMEKMSVTPVVQFCAAPPGGGRGVSLVLPFVGPLLREQLPDHATVHGLWQS